MAPTGPDRFALYLVAAATGFRANAVATAARFAKNRRTKVQPLPADVADVLREYLIGRPDAALVWGGTWRGKAAETLRADLEAVGIPYAIKDRTGRNMPTFTNCGIRF